MSTSNPLRFSRPLHFWLASALVIAALGASRVAWPADAPVIPLPPEVADALKILGEGVVGKALPAPPLTDPEEYLNLGSGSWEYQIVSGGKDGQKVRSEKYERAPDEDGAEVWKRTVGTEFNEYLRFDKEGRFGKLLEDDLELGYTARFDPGVMWQPDTKPGPTRTFESKISAYKTGKPEKISFTGKMTSKLSYVGQYEVKTPAGTFPALLVRDEFKIEVGPAKVTDTMYCFYAKGVGKVAEVESTRIAALFVYHSNTKVAKVLKTYPKH